MVHFVMGSGSGSVIPPAIYVDLNYDYQCYQLYWWLSILIPDLYSHDFSIPYILLLYRLGWLNWTNELVFDNVFVTWLREWLIVFLLYYIYELIFDFVHPMN